MIRYSFNKRIELSFFSISGLWEIECKDKVSWCKNANPDCSKPFVSERCQKYCNLCPKSKLKTLLKTLFLVEINKFELNKRKNVLTTHFYRYRNSSYGPRERKKEHR